MCVASDNTFCLMKTLYCYCQLNTKFQQVSKREHFFKVYKIYCSFRH